MIRLNLFQIISSHSSTILDAFYAMDRNISAKAVVPVHMADSPHEIISDEEYDDILYHLTLIDGNIDDLKNFSGTISTCMMMMTHDWKLSAGCFPIIIDGYPDFLSIVSVVLHHRVSFD